MNNELFSLPVFGILLTIACFYCGNKARNVLPLPLINPMIIATSIIIVIISLTPLSLEAYMNGGRFITLFITPATTALALLIHKQWARFKENIFPVFAGCFAGSIVSLISIYFLCKLFKIDEMLLISLLPKSVTTAIAMELSAKNGGLPGITVAAVTITGMSGAVLNPFYIKLFKLKNTIAAGVAMGTSAHAIGTASAIEMGETQGALSGIALVITGIITSVLFLCAGGAGLL